MHIDILAQTHGQTQVCTYGETQRKTVTQTHRCTYIDIHRQRHTNTGDTQTLLWKYT